MGRRKYLYHITQQKWHKEKILKPRVLGEFRLDEEPETPRICVAPTIEGCLVAVGRCLDKKKPIYIYRTKYKVSSVLPENIIDCKITCERWIIRPVKFIKVGEIDKNKLPQDFFSLHIGHSDGRVRRRQKSMKRVLGNIIWMPQK